MRAGRQVHATASCLQVAASCGCVTGIASGYHLAPFRLQQRRLPVTRDTAGDAVHLPKVEEIREEGPALVVCVANKWLLLPYIVLERGVILFAAGTDRALIDCNTAEHSAS